MCNINLSEKINAYQASHSKTINKILHYIGIPLVIFSLMVFTSWIHIRVPGVFDLPLVWALSITVLVFYFCMDITLAAIVTGFFIVFNLIISLMLGNYPNWVNLQIFIYAFIIGWIFLFIELVIARKKFAFLEQIKFLFFAPMFLASELMSVFNKKLKINNKTS